MHAKSRIIPGNNCLKKRALQPGIRAALYALIVFFALFNGLGFHTTGQPRQHRPGGLFSVHAVTPSPGKAGGRTGQRLAGLPCARRCRVTQRTYYATGRRVNPGGALESVAHAREP